MEFYCITTKKPDLHLPLTNHDIFPTPVYEQLFIICLRTNLCVQRYGGVLASYPDVSLSFSLRAKEGGKEKTGFTSLLAPSRGPLRFVTSSLSFCA